MPILVLHPDPESNQPAEKCLRQLVEHLRLRWPGTLVLVATCQTPADGHIESTVDRVRLPGPDQGWTDHKILSAELLEPIIRRYEIPVAVGIGDGSTSLMDLVAPHLKHTIRLPSGGGRSFEKMDRKLSGILPVEILAAPDLDLEKLSGQLQNHAAWKSGRPVLVRWRGKSPAGLSGLLDFLCAQTSAPVELRLLTSYYFQVPRSGSAHTPRDLLLRGTAWAQMLSFARLAWEAPGQVTIRMRTLSRKNWIRQAVGLANRGTGWLRSARRMMPGGGR